MSEREIKLFITDLDHTALGGHEPYNRFPDAYSTFLDRLHDHGIAWATCTSWHPWTQDEMLACSAVRSRPLRLIGRNGLCCARYESGRLVLDAQWDADTLNRQAEYFTDHLPLVRRAIRDSDAVELVREDLDFVHLLRLLDEERGRRQLREHPVFQRYTLVLFTSNGGAQIFPAFMSKGGAIQRMQAELGIAPEHTAVAGDGPNDLTMFDRALASVCLAPDNADPEVQTRLRAIGGFIGTSRYCDGVIQAARLAQLL